MNDIFDEIERDIYQYGGSWTAFIIRALWPHSKGLSRQAVIDAILEDALERGRKIPRSFADTIQSTFQKHNGESDVFTGDRKNDIFRFVGKKGSGVWTQIKPKALIWMADNGRATDFSVSLSRSAPRPAP